jgi:hypothetical protein
LGDHRTTDPSNVEHPSRAGGSNGSVGTSGAIEAGAARQVTERDAPERGSTGPVDTFDAMTDSKGDPIPEVAYDGGMDKVFRTDSQKQVTDAGPIAGGAGTVSFWVKPEWAAGDQHDATLIQFGDSGLELTKNVNFLMPASSTVSAATWVSGRRANGVTWRRHG